MKQCPRYVKNMCITKVRQSAPKAGADVIRACHTGCQRAAIEAWCQWPQHICMDGHGRTGMSVLSMFPVDGMAHMSKMLSVMHTPDLVRRTPSAKARAADRTAPCPFAAHS